MFDYALIHQIENGHGRSSARVTLMTEMRHRRRAARVMAKLEMATTSAYYIARAHGLFIYRFFMSAMTPASSPRQRLYRRTREPVHLISKSRQESAPRAD